MISDLQSSVSAFEPIDDAAPPAVRRPPPQPAPNIGMLIVISLQAVTIVALICVAIILGGKIDMTQRAMTEAKDAAELAQQAASSSAAHVRYISCEVQRTRPRSPTAYFDAPFQCDPPPPDATGPAAAPATRPAAPANAPAAVSPAPASPASGKGN